MSETRRWHAELAWLGAGEVEAGVLIEAAGPVLRTVTPGVAASALEGALLGRVAEIHGPGR